MLTLTLITLCRHIDIFDFRFRHYHADAIAAIDVYFHFVIFMLDAAAIDIFFLFAISLLPLAFR